MIAALNATSVRKNWSAVTDDVIRSKPQFVKRTRDTIMLANLELMAALLEQYQFSAAKYIEADQSVTLSLDQIDIVENGATEEKARHLLGKAILDYATDFYNEFSVWSKAPNRKTHIPYVIKALILDNEQMIGDMVICRVGRNSSASVKKTAGTIRKRTTIISANKTKTAVSGTRKCPRERAKSTNTCGRKSLKNN
jgi:hypothetical protein